MIIACAFLSMWISNAATALMMLPIGPALVEEIRQRGFYDEAWLKTSAQWLLFAGPPTWLLLILLSLFITGW